MKRAACVACALLLQVVVSSSLEAQSVDLFVTFSNPPARAATGVAVDYVFSVGGLAGSTGAFLTTVFQPAVTFSPAGSSAGCVKRTAAGDPATTVICPSPVSPVTIRVIPQGTGTLNVTAGVIGNQADPVMANNSALATMTVTAPWNDALYVRQTVPSSVAAGAQFTATVTFKNSGTTTWSESTFHRLGQVGDATSFGSRVFLGSGETVAPGVEKTFTISRKAPNTIGTYRFQTQMLEELKEWFGGLSPLINVQVTPGNGATFVAQTVPSTVQAGTAFTASVTFRNTGTATWTAFDNHRLGEQVPGDAWGGRVYLSATESVMPGQEKTFVIATTAPTAAGSYSFTWRMVHELVEWFGEGSPTVSVAVTPRALTFFPLLPCRVLDTRNANGTYGGPALVANQPRFLPMHGVCGVPSTARAVAATVVVIGPATDGHLWVYPANLPAPPGSTVLNFRTGIIRSNNAIVSQSRGGQLAVQPGISSTHLLLDVAGYYE